MLSQRQNFGQKPQPCPRNFRPIRCCNPSSESSKKWSFLCWLKQVWKLNNKLILRIKKDHQIIILKIYHHFLPSFIFCDAVLELSELDSLEEEDSSTSMTNRGVGRFATGSRGAIWERYTIWSSFKKKRSLWQDCLTSNQKKMQKYPNIPYI